MGSRPRHIEFVEHKGQHYAIDHSFMHVDGTVAQWFRSLRLAQFPIIHRPRPNPSTQER